MIAILIVTAATTGWSQSRESRYEEFRYSPVAISWNALSYSRQGHANLTGGDLSFTYMGTPYIGVTADLAANRSGTIAGFGSSTVEFDTNTGRFGPKFVLRPAKRVSPFAEALFGPSWITVRVKSGNLDIEEKFKGLGIAVGGGLDIRVKPWLAIRAVQLDYSHLGYSDLNISSNGIRVGAGLVFNIANAYWRAK